MVICWRTANLHSRCILFLPYDVVFIYSFRVSRTSHDANYDFHTKLFYCTVLRFSQTLCFYFSVPSCRVERPHGGLNGNDKVAEWTRIGISQSCSLLWVLLAELSTPNARFAPLAMFQMYSLTCFFTYIQAVVTRAIFSGCIKTSCMESRCVRMLTDSA